MDGSLPLSRPRLVQRLQAGDQAIDAAMLGSQFSFQKNAVLIQKGATKGVIYRICSGLVARYRIRAEGRRQIIMIGLPGDLVGLQGMLMGRDGYSVSALSPTTVQRLDYDAALELARSDPDVAMRFMRQLAEEERRLQNWLVALGRGSAIERLATFILDLRRRLAPALLPPDRRFSLPLTQNELGDHLGLTVVHVNRSLRSLREAGAVIFKRGMVEILDLSALRACAGSLLDVFEREGITYIDHTRVYTPAPPVLGRPEINRPFEAHP